MATEQPLAGGTEQPLAGGMNVNAGVVRIGDTVRRPARPYSPAVNALLRHLEDVGFDGAPRHLGTDEQGRDVLSYVDGDVPLPPYPGWSMTDQALEDLARLLRRFHEATASFDRAGVDGWAEEWNDPLGGPVICHNDLYPENVVFRDGRVVALIDFAMAAPGRTFWDLAIALQEWCPLKDPAARVDHPAGLDAIGRIGRFTRAYGVDPADAAELVEVLFEERAQSVGHIRAEVADGNPVWTEHWQHDGGEGRAAVDDAWLAANRNAFDAAVRGGITSPASLARP